MSYLLNKSIILAPILIAILNLIAILFSFHQFNKNNKEERVIKHFLPSEKKDKNIFSAWRILQEYKKQKQIEYILKGDAEDDNKIEIIKLQALQIKYSCDTNTVIKIHFRDNTTYGEVIRLLDIMMADKHKRYMLYQNDLYIAPPKPIDCIEEELSIQPLFI